MSPSNEECVSSRHLGRTHGPLVGAILFGLLALIPRAASAQGTTYSVGPGQSLASLGEVPWEALMPGDLVEIHWRSEPYREKFVLGRSGTEQAPIVIRGIAGPDGALPTIDGRNATTRAELNYWNEARGVIKVGGSNTPSAVPPSGCGCRVATGRPLPHWIWLALIVPLALGRWRWKTWRAAR